MHISGVLIDIDGVLTVSWQPLPGAVAALRQLRTAGLPDLLAAALARPVGDLQPEMVSQRQLPTPAKLARQHAAVQQHHSRSPADALDEQAFHRPT